MAHVNPRTSSCIVVQAPLTTGSTAKYSIHGQDRSWDGNPRLKPVYQQRESNRRTAYLHSKDLRGDIECLHTGWEWRVDISIAGVEHDILSVAMVSLVHLHRATCISLTAILAVGTMPGSSTMRNRSQLRFQTAHVRRAAKTAQGINGELSSYSRRRTGRSGIEDEFCQVDHQVDALATVEKSSRHAQMNMESSYS